MKKKMQSYGTLIATLREGKEIRVAYTRQVMKSNFVSFTLSVDSLLRS